MKQPETPAVIVDIDGTIARRTDRGPHDLHRVSEDEPVEHVIELVKNLRDHYQLVFMSGRKDSARRDTEAWLAKHVGWTGSEPVIMRDARDNRKDSLVKAELYDAHVAGQYDVRFVLDDRDQVVRMWRDRGLTCLQVAYGDF